MSQVNYSVFGPCAFKRLAGFCEPSEVQPALRRSFEKDQFQSGEVRVSNYRRVFLRPGVANLVWSLVLKCCSWRCPQRVDELEAQQRGQSFVSTAVSWSRHQGVNRYHNLWMQCSRWQATDNKMAAVSLFTGVAGLELGLAKPDSQEPNKVLSFGWQVCVVEMKFLWVSQLFGFRRLKLEVHSIFVWDLSQCPDFW